MSWFSCFKSLQEELSTGWISPNWPPNHPMRHVEPQSRLAMQLCSGLHGHSWDPKIGQKCQKPVRYQNSWDLLDSMSLHPQISLYFRCKSFLVRPRWASLLVRQVSCWLQQSQHASHVAIGTYQRNLQLLPKQPRCIPHGTPWTLHSTHDARRNMKKHHVQFKCRVLMKNICIIYVICLYLSWPWTKHWKKNTCLFSPSNRIDVCSSLK